MVVEEIVDLINLGNYTMAEKLSIQMINNHPFVSQGWVFLGQILIQQGFGNMARKVLQRAHLLEPRATWLEVAEDSLQKTALGESLPSIESLLKLNYQPTVAAALIVKNEERCISRCLASLTNAVDEIILVDTGSTDRTKEIAREFNNVRIFDYKWCDDFSAARNFALDQVTSEWILIVDADEHLLTEDIPKIREAAAIFEMWEGPLILQLVERHYASNLTQVDYDLSRFFSRKHGFFYKGIVHEQLGLFNTDTPIAYSGVNIHLMHDGYDRTIEQNQNKVERNLTLLKKKLENDPESVHSLFFYGKELLLHSKLDEAIVVLTKLVKYGEQFGFTRLLEVYVMLIKAFYSLHQFKKVEFYCKKALQLQSDFPDVWFYIALLHYEGKDYSRAHESLSLAKDGFSTYRGVISADQEILQWKADFFLADLLLAQGKPNEAIPIYEAIVERVPANIKLDILKKADDIRAQL